MQDAPAHCPPRPRCCAATRRGTLAHSPPGGSAATAAVRTGARLSGAAAVAVAGPDVIATARVTGPAAIAGAASLREAFLSRGMVRLPGQEWLLLTLRESVSPDPTTDHATPTTITNRSRNPWSTRPQPRPRHPQARTGLSHYNDGDEEARERPARPGRGLVCAPADRLCSPRPLCIPAAICTLSAGRFVQPRVDTRHTREKPHGRPRP